MSWEQFGQEVAVVGRQWFELDFVRLELGDTPEGRAVDDERSGRNWTVRIEWDALNRELVKARGTFASLRPS